MNQSQQRIKNFLDALRALTFEDLRGTGILIENLANTEDALATKLPKDEEEAPTYRFVGHLFGDRPIQAIKSLRTLTDLPLKEAKEIVHDKTRLYHRKMNEQGADYIRRTYGLIFEKVA